MPRPFCLLLVALSFLALSPPVRCQSTDFVPILSGDKYPLTRKLKDLDSTWRQMSVSKASGLDVVAVFTLSRGFAGGDPYYTKGETVAVSGEIFLVAYHRLYTQGEIALMGSNVQSPVAPPSPETALTLSLINLRHISSLDGIQAYVPQTAAEAAQDQEKSLEDTSVSNLKQLGLAMIQYTQDYDEKLPPMQSASATKTAIFPYVKSDAVFEQPQTHALYQPNTSLSHRAAVSFADPNAMVIYYEPSPAPDGKRAVLFLDGHVKRVEESEWQRLKAASHIPKPAAKVQ